MEGKGNRQRASNPSALVTLIRMTKVLVGFDLLRPLDEALMKRLADAHGQYGLLRVRLARSLDHLEVEYDAARLTEDEVEASLRRAGIPAKRRE